MAKNRPPQLPAPVVRDATGADLDALAACYARAPHRERIASANGKTIRYLVVEVGGEVVGFGRLVMAQIPGVPAMPFLPKIVNLNVRPDMQGRGLGTALIRALERLAWAAGCDFLHIGVHEANVPALALYRRLGYVEVGELLVDASSEYEGGPPAGHAKVIYLRKGRESAY